MMKIKVANKGEKIMDYCGYVYEVQDVFSKYVSVGNGVFVMHEDYMILPGGLEEDIKILKAIHEKIYANHGKERLDEWTNAILNRFDYLEEGKWDPSHVFTFETYGEQEGDNDYEYEYPEGCSCSG